MPVETRLFVKTSLAYLAIAFALGGALLVLEALGKPLPFVVGIEHGHLGFVGWLVNVVIGIALWLLPLNRERFPQTKGRYPAAAVWLCYALLNIGLLLRVIFEPLFALGHTDRAISGVLIASGIMQPLAIAVFVWIAWQRVVGPRVPAR